MKGGTQFQEAFGRAAESSPAPVSVIVPCFRCAETIERAVHSIARQDLRPAEVILVDDGSGDGTLQKLRELKDSFEAGWIKLIALPENQGPSVARNAGWNAATQPYVAFLDADDSWHPSKIAVQYTWMAAHPDVCLTGHLQVRRSTACPPSPEQPEATKISGSRMLIRNKCLMSSVMLQRSLPYRFAEDKHRSEDYHLWLTILLKGHAAFFINSPLAYYHKAPFGQNGLSKSLLLMHRGHADTYSRLYKDNLISGRVHLLLRAWVWLRLARQIALVMLRGRDRAPDQE